MALEKQGRDDGLRERYGLHEEVDLGGEEVERGKEMWEAGRERAGLAIDAGPSGSNAAAGDTSRATRGTPVTSKGKGKAADFTPDLASLLRKTTAKKYDPFSDGVDSLFSGSPSPGVPVRVRTRLKEVASHASQPPDRVHDPPSRASGLTGLADYDSD